MTFDLYAAFFAFAAVMAFTPGPNNALLMATGLSFGFRRTLPAVIGVAFGFSFLALCVGVALGFAASLVPQIMPVLRWGGAAYMLWLAWKIAVSAPSENESDSSGKPLNFLQVAALQWVNPKAWIMAITSLSNFTLPEHYSAGLAAIVATFVCTGIASAATWAAFGAALKRWLTDARWYRAINIGLALLLVVSIIPILAH